MILRQGHGSTDNGGGKGYKVILTVATLEEQAEGIITFPARDTGDGAMARRKSGGNFHARNASKDNCMPGTWIGQHHDPVAAGFGQIAFDQSA